LICSGENLPTIKIIHNMLIRTPCKTLLPNIQMTHTMHNCSTQIRQQHLVSVPRHGIATDVDYPLILSLLLLLLQWQQAQLQHCTSPAPQPKQQLQRPPPAPAAAAPAIHH
jgi:hypothetical protein